MAEARRNVPRQGTQVALRANPYPFCPSSRVRSVRVIDVKPDLVEKIARVLLPANARDLHLEDRAVAKPLEIAFHRRSKRRLPPEPLSRERIGIGQSLSGVRFGLDQSRQLVEAVAVFGADDITRRRQHPGHQRFLAVTGAPLQEILRD